MAAVSLDSDRQARIIDLIGSHALVTASIGCRPELMVHRFCIIVCKISTYANRKTVNVPIRAETLSKARRP
jgi:hypothetical protein